MSCAFASICARRLPDVTISAALPGAYQMNLDRPSFAQLNVNELLISPLARNGSVMTAKEGYVGHSGKLEVGTRKPAVPQVRQAGRWVSCS
jgi:hypothetical protein